MCFRHSKGAPNYKDAHAIASKISTSALVKTALYGEDAKYVNSVYSAMTIAILTKSHNFFSPSTSALFSTLPFFMDLDKLPVGAAYSQQPALSPFLRLLPPTYHQRLTQRRSRSHLYLPTVPRPFQFSSTENLKKSTKIVQSRS